MGGMVTVYISQRLVCDICTKDVRMVDQSLVEHAVPYVITRDYLMNHQGSMLDVCGTCMPSLMKAAASLRLATLVNSTTEGEQ